MGGHGREHEDGNRTGLFAFSQDSADLPTGYIREHDVQENQVRRAGLSGLQGFSSAMGDDGPIGFFL